MRMMDTHRQKKARTDLTPDMIAGMKSAYESGEPIKLIAATFGVVRITVVQRAQRDGWDKAAAKAARPARRRANPLPDFSAEVRRAFESGSPWRDLAAMAGASAQVVRYRAIAHHYDFRARAAAIAARSGPKESKRARWPVAAESPTDKRPCVKGHTRRSAKSGVCLECARERQTARRRDRADEIRRTNREWKSRNREWVKESDRRTRNPDAMRSANMQRRARERGAVVTRGPAYTTFMRRARTEPRIDCYWCGERTTPDARHVDHIVPLARGGSDSPANLCIACPKCNFSKGAKEPFVFAGQAEIAFA